MQTSATSPFPLLWSTLLALVLACGLAAGHRRAVADDAVSDAIDHGIKWLLEQIEAQQVGQHKYGQTALETYALVVAGVSVDHPLIKKNFDFLHGAIKKNKPHTYSLSCYVFALDAAIAQIENDFLILTPKKVQLKFRDNPRLGREYRPHLQSAVGTLVSMQNALGAWRYGANAQDFDNSNVQFAVLALGVGAKRRVPIEPSVWQKIMSHFVKGQQAKGAETKERLTLSDEGGDRRDIVKLIPKDGKKTKARGKSKEKEDKGDDERTVVRKPRTVVPEDPVIGTEDIQVFQRGWDYTNKGGSSWNMTCAGLSSLLLVRDNLRGKLTGDEHEAINKSIRDGYGWVMTRWAPNGNYYGIYSLEKVADIGGVEKFGSHDWYEEISKYLVSAQQADGSWSDNRGARVATSFALLVLNRATSLLTTNPASRIVISGRGGAKDPNDRSWVYVESIDASVHYPTLLRQIRLRPSAKLISFLRNIVKSYPPEWKGELIPEMAKVRDAIPHKATRRVIEGYLQDITGYRYKNWEDYLKWHRRWERVILIGMQKKKERISDLLKYYESTKKSIPLKQTVAWALERCAAKAAIPLFLDDLSHRDASMRLTAYSSFRSFFLDFPPPFNPTASKGSREAQIKKIREWYRVQQDKAGG